MTALLVATSGGHLRQLHELRPRLPGADDAVWFTLDTPQSRSLLAGEEVVFGHPTPPRSVIGTLRNAATAVKLLRSRTFTSAVSTGATLAVSTLPAAAALGVSTHYIESATRVSGPSLSGRLLRATPGVHTYTQYPAWAHGSWHYGGSIFDGFSPQPRPSVEVSRVLVTLGTTDSFPFRRLVEAVDRIVPPTAEVIWQSGSVELQERGVASLSQIPSEEFDELLRSVDAVIAHAGTGTSVAALRAGKLPILVPRRADHGEHIDDHQVEIASELDRRGLALRRDVDELTWEDVAHAASWTILPAEHVPSFRLRG
jgi:UDP-N-acetylglucosamine--N-acetylmuramyl-(pentapeptide) pyrophosphoryl-undecaprenol N-acetylglucosamine transferase